MILKIFLHICSGSNYMTLWGKKETLLAIAAREDRTHDHSRVKNACLRPLGHLGLVMSDSVNH